MPSFRRPSLPSVLTPSRSPSNHAFASSRGSSRERSLLIDFPSGWGNGLVMAWYKRRKATIIQRLELRKEHDPFQHEYVLITLLDGAMFRLDRRPDPGVPVDTLMRKGCRAFDTLDEVVEGDELEPWHCVVDMHLHEDNQIDILRILEICYEVHSDVETRRYTLQRYNCYFMAWTTLLVISRLCSEISTQMSTRDAGMNQPFQTEIDDLAADIKTDLVRHLLRFSLWGQGIPPTLARFSHIGSESMAELLREDTLHQDFESLLEDLVIRLAQSVLLPGLWQDIQLEAAQKEPYENGQLGQNAAQLEQRMVQKVLERASYYLVSAFRAKGLPVDQSEPMRGVARNIAETWFRIVLESSRRQMIRLVQSLWQAGPPCPVVHVYKTGPKSELPQSESSSPVQLQEIGRSFIKDHADRVERYQLGRSADVQNDIENAMQRTWLTFRHRNHRKFLSTPRDPAAGEPTQLPLRHIERSPNARFGVGFDLHERQLFAQFIHPLNRIEYNY